MSLQTFSPTPWVVISLSWQCPLKHKSFNFRWSRTSIFPFVACALVSYLRILCQIQYHEYLPPCLLSFTSLSRSLTVTFFDFWDFFNMWCEVKSSASFFVCGSPAVAAQFLEKTIFPHWMVLAPCWKSVKHRCMGLYLDSRFYSIVLYVYLYAVKCLGHCCFVVPLKSARASPLNLSFFIIALPILDSLQL